MPLIDVLVEMELTGIGVDPAVLSEQSAVLAEKVEELRIKMMEVAAAASIPIRPSSLPTCCSTACICLSSRGPRPGPSTDVEVLEKLAANTLCRVRSRPPQPRQARRTRISTTSSST